MAATLRDSKVDLLSTKIIDFHQRQIKNAALAIDDDDYVILKQLNDAIDELNTKIAKINNSSPTVTKIVNSPVIGFIIADGSTGTDVGPEILAASSGTLNTFRVRVKASDSITNLAFNIKINGTIIASTTVAAGTSVSTISPPFATLNISKDDVFTIDITSGSSSWKFTVILRG